MIDKLLVSNQDVKFYRFKNEIKVVISLIGAMSDGENITDLSDTIRKEISDSIDKSHIKNILILNCNRDRIIPSYDGERLLSLFKKNLQVIDMALRKKDYGGHSMPNIRNDAVYLGSITDAMRD